MVRTSKIMAFKCSFLLNQSKLSLKLSVVLIIFIKSFLTIRNTAWASCDFGTTRCSQKNLRTHSLNFVCLRLFLFPLISLVSTEQLYFFLLKLSQTIQPLAKPMYTALLKDGRRRTKLGVSHARNMWMTGRRALNRIIDQASLVLFHCRPHRSSQMLKTIIHAEKLDTH